MDDDTTIDIDTLEAVHRLLASTEFVSAKDLASRGLVPAAGRSSTAATSSTAVRVDGSDPLPRRR